MDQIVVKIIVIVCLLILTISISLLPTKIRNEGGGFATRQRFLSYCNCFAGGVFLATSLLDLLPMIEEKFQSAFNDYNIQTDFPVAEFTTCIGFFFVLLLEQIVHTFHEKSFLHGHHDIEVHKPLLGNRKHPNQSHNSNDNDSFAARQRSLDERQDFIRNKEVKTEGSIRTYILVMAISLHSIFEGLSLGLLTEVNRLIQIAAAIAIHKSVIGFAMVVSMVQHKMAFSFIVKAIVIFSIMSPIGILIGIGVLDSSSLNSSNLASGILQGIANGTFIYVTFFEILQTELARKGNRLLKVLFIIIGYSVVTGVLYYSSVLEGKPEKNSNAKPTQVTSSSH